MRVLLASLRCTVPPGSERLRASNLPAVHPSSLLALLLLLLLLSMLLLSVPEERDRRSEAVVLVAVEGCNDNV